MVSKLKANPQNRVVLMEGTPNERVFFLENPSQLTEGDIAKIKNAYGIPEDTTLQKTREILKDIETQKITSPIEQIPFEKGTAEYAAELFAKTADVQERAELILLIVGAE